MTRRPTRRARPTIPPATPPAIAPVFDFVIGAAVWFGDWLGNWLVVAAAWTLVETDVGEDEPCAVDAPWTDSPHQIGALAVLVDVGDSPKSNEP